MTKREKIEKQAEIAQNEAKEKTYRQKITENTKIEESKINSQLILAGKKPQRKSILERFKAFFSKSA